MQGQRISINSAFVYNNQSQNYKVAVVANDESLELKLEDQKSGECWKNTFGAKYVTEITEKTGRPMAYGQFIQQLCVALQKKTEALFVDIMSSFDLESIKIKRGGQPSQQNMKANKRYIILSLSAGEARTHYPLPLNPVETDSNEKLKSMIGILYEELTTLRSKNTNDKSSSIMEDSSTQADYLKAENDQLKILIKEAEEQVAQKKGAVEMDQIIREKNDLELKVQGIRREENKQIAKLKSIFAMKDRELTQIKNEINLITRQLQNGDQTNPKLKSHLLRVTKANEAELNNSKKLTAKQLKEIDNINRNLLTCKNNQKKLLGKIKILQTEIDQAKKKANLKEISNRLHSPASSKKSNISAPNVRPANRVVVNLNRHSSTKTDDGSSAASKDSKPRSYHAPVRQNIVKPVARPDQFKSPHLNPLMRTTPALKTTTSSKDRAIPSSTLTRPYTRNAPPVPVRRQTSINSSERNSTSIERKKNNFVGSFNRVPVSGIPRNSREPVAQQKRSNSKQIIKPAPRNVPMSSSRQKIEASEKEKNIFNKIEQIKNRFNKNTAPQKPTKPYEPYKKK